MIGPVLAIKWLMKALLLCIGFVLVQMDVFAQSTVEKVDSGPAQTLNICPAGSHEGFQLEADLVIQSIKSFRRPEDIFHLSNDPEQLEVWTEIQNEELPQRIFMSNALLKNHPELQEVLGVWSALTKNSDLGRTLNQTDKLNLFFINNGSPTGMHSGTLTIDIHIDSVLWLKSLLSAKDFQNYLVSLLSHELSHILVDWYNIKKHKENFVAATISDHSLHLLVDVVAMKLTGQKLSEFQTSFQFIKEFYDANGQSSGDIPDRLECFSSWQALQ